MGVGEGIEFFNVFPESGEASVCDSVGVVSVGGDNLHLKGLIEDLEDVSNPGGAALLLELFVEVGASFTILAVSDKGLVCEFVG